MSVAEGLGAAKAGVELAKRLMDLLNRPDIDVNDVHTKLQEMLIHVVNAQVALAEAQSDIADLRHRVEQLELLKQVEDDMDYRIDGGFYVRKSERDKGVIGYCPLCWKHDQKAVPLRTGATEGWFHCDIHGSSYETAEYRQRRSQQSHSVARFSRRGMR